jgi:hypothetical protein
MILEKNNYDRGISRLAEIENWKSIQDALSESKKIIAALF